MSGEVTAPKLFAGLHAHSHFSTFDGLGTPQEHIDFVLENGMDAWALTDHGNMSGFCHAHTKTKEVKKAGRDFKFVPGVEAYYHPDLDDWRKSHTAAKEARDEIKRSKNQAVKVDKEDLGTLENEADTKDTSKWFDPVRRRHHLVLLPTSRTGLENIFKLVSRSFKEGFYRFPRIDRKMLKEHGEDVIVTSACLHPDSILITDSGPQRIEDVVTLLNSGEAVQVLSWDEAGERACFKRVLWGDRTRRDAKLFRIKLKNGESIKLTGDHDVSTQRGWIKVSELRLDDRILSTHQ